MRTSAVALAAALALAPFAPSLVEAAEVAGVTVEESIQTQGQSLSLVGAGLRRKLVFNVYVAGLYMQSPSTDANTVITSEQPKAMEMVLKMGLSGDRIAGSIEEGFTNNSSAEQMSALRERLDRLTQMFPNASAGDRVLITYVPGTGTVLQHNGNTIGTIEGADFAQAMFRVWFGSSPADANLKAAILGG